MTASSFSSVSMDPLLVLVCLNRSARTYDDVLSRERFGINILSADCVEISNQCARPGEDKSLRPEWLEDPVEARPPALKDSLAFLDCEIHTEVPAGTHSIIVGRVLAIGVSEAEEDKPLLYYRGSYREMAATESVSV
jgi:flavin reductase (DIM6/NTAB) family NADH-FMN oxidoreductase RutF